MLLGLFLFLKKCYAPQFADATKLGKKRSHTMEIKTLCWPQKHKKLDTSNIYLAVGIEPSPGNVDNYQVIVAKVGSDSAWEETPQ